MIGEDKTAASTRADDEAPTILEGALKKIRESGVVSIGYREQSFPFSYVRGGPPQGYSIDLCGGIVDEVVRQLHGAALKINYQLVTADNRMEAIASGKVDLECGSTTSNLERQKSVAFSPVIFVAGAKLLVKRGSGVETWRDLAGKALVVTSGATNEQAMRVVNDKFKLGMVIAAPSPQWRAPARWSMSTANGFYARSLRARLSICRSLCNSPRVCAPWARIFIDGNTTSRQQIDLVGMNHPLQREASRPAYSQHDQSAGHGEILLEMQDLIDLGKPGVKHRGGDHAKARERQSRWPREQSQHQKATAAEFNGDGERQRFTRQAKGLRIFDRAGIIAERGDGFVQKDGGQQQPAAQHRGRFHCGRESRAFHLFRFQRGGGG